MIYLNLDKPISGDLLQQELLAQGLATDVVVYTFDDGLKIQFNNANETDRDLVEAVYQAHIAPSPTGPTIAEKLASVGLSLDDLKKALGL